MHFLASLALIVALMATQTAAAPSEQPVLPLPHPTILNNRYKVGYTTSKDFYVTSNVDPSAPSLVAKCAYTPEDISKLERELALVKQAAPLSTLVEDKFTFVPPKELTGLEEPTKPRTCFITVASAPNTLVEFLKANGLKKDAVRPYFFQLVKKLKVMHEKKKIAAGYAFIESVVIVDEEIKWNNFAQAAPVSPNGVADDVRALGLLMRAGFGNGKNKKHLSDTDATFKDLIDKMIEKDGAKRITLNQVLEHPWWTRAAVLPKNKAPVK